MECESFVGRVLQDACVYVLAENVWAVNEQGERASFPVGPDDDVDAVPWWFGLLKSQVCLSDGGFEFGEVGYREDHVIFVLGMIFEERSSDFDGPVCLAHSGEGFEDLWHDRRHNVFR